MSNRIPSIETPDDIPYCIWYPSIGLETTYRDLARIYPQMRYQVGRACALAGYTEPFNELDILPDVSHAEEAREAGNLHIYHHIMSEPIIYQVMNDYDRTVTIDAPRPGFLNADTAVKSLLDNTKQKPDRPRGGPDDPNDIWDGFYPQPGYEVSIFNITEDMNLDEEPSTYSMKKDHEVARLLYTPLPYHLPTINKTFLILMAAYSGNVDRYARLRHPRMISGEWEFCVHGIYHETMFAVWWSKQDLTDVKGRGAIEAAICARFIMNNSLSRALDPRMYPEPYMIWYPMIAQPSTYRKLAELQPRMLPQIVRACIVGDYNSLFDELVVDLHPDDAVMLEASGSTNSQYKTSLEERARICGGVKEAAQHEHVSTHRSLMFNRSDVCQYVGHHRAFTGFHSLYGDFAYADPGEALLMSCIPDEWRVPSSSEDRERNLDYVDWPEPNGLLVQTSATITRRTKSNYGREICEDRPLTEAAAKRTPCW